MQTTVFLTQFQTFGTQLKIQSDLIGSKSVLNCLYLCNCLLETIKISEY